MKTQVHWMDDHFVVKHSDVLTIRDIVFLYDTLSGSPEYRRARFGIIDASEVRTITYSERDFKTHAAYGMAIATMGQKPDMKVGLIVTSPEVAAMAKSMIAQFDRSETRWQRRVFDNWDQAFHWASS